MRTSLYFLSFRLFPPVPPPGAPGGRAAPRSPLGEGGPGGPEVAPRELGNYRVPRWAYTETVATLLLSMNDGPVSTVWPPPMTSPLVRYSHSESTDS
jgi:hypothetical protein